MVQRPIEAERGISRTMITYSRFFSLLKMQPLTTTAKGEEVVLR